MVLLFLFCLFVELQYICQPVDQLNTNRKRKYFAPIKLLLCSFQDKIDCDNVVKIGTCSLLTPRHES